jgi:hypothetical protein
MDFQILKQEIDDGGNVGYIFDQDFTGNIDAVIQKIKDLIADDGIIRFAQLSNDAGVQDIWP